MWNLGLLFNCGMLKKSNLELLQSLMQTKNCKIKTFVKYLFTLTFDKKCYTSMTLCKDNFETEMLKLKI